MSMPYRRYRPYEPVSLSDRWAPNGGRLFVTSLSIYMLETYYRHLPIYKWRLQ